MVSLVSQLQDNYIDKLTSLIDRIIVYSYQQDTHSHKQTTTTRLWLKVEQAKSTMTWHCMPAKHNG